MRILHVYKQSHPFHGGIETFIATLQEMFPNSFELTYISYRGSRNGRLKSLGKFKSQPIGFPIIRLCTTLRRYDVIHLHYPTITLDLAVLFLLSTIYSKKSLVLSYHAGVTNSRFGAYLWGWSFFEKALLNRANQIHVSNERVLNLKGLEFKSSIIPFPFKREIDISNDLIDFRFKSKTILFVGSLRAYKGLDVLLSSLTLCSHFWRECLIIGQGEEKVKLLDQIQNYGLAQRVSILSGISDLELATYYRSSSLLVLPSINNSETFGIVQVEALAAGLPVINTQLDTGVPFVSIHGKSGLTVEPANISALANAIIKLFSDRSLYLRFSLGAKQLSEKYSTESVKRSFVEFYGKVERVG